MARTVLYAPAALFGRPKFYLANTTKPAPFLVPAIRATPRHSREKGRRRSSPVFPRENDEEERMAFYNNDKTASKTTKIHSKEGSWDINTPEHKMTTITRDHKPVTKQVTKLKEHAGVWR